jgi:hypothetical protein
MELEKRLPKVKNELKSMKKEATTNKKEAKSQKETGIHDFFFPIGAGRGGDTSYQVRERPG